MARHGSSRAARRLLAAIVAVPMLATILPAIPAAAVDVKPRIPVIAPGSAYRQRNISSDIPGLALTQDPLLVNPWGLAAPTGQLAWIANSGTSSSTRYRGSGSGGAPLAPEPGYIVVPGGLPTGIVSNTTTDFEITSGSATAPARFVFASITGNILGWNRNVPATGSHAGVVGASHPGHVYTGLALANNGSGNFLYAADFANGTVDVFDKDFALQPGASFPFADPTIPTTVGNTFHPYGIQAIGGSVYVTYAKVGTGGREEPGVGNGFVRRFNTNGVRDLTFGINNGALNVPWGAVVAPASFGIFGNALLIGNAGQGNPSIHAYNPVTGAFLGTLQDESGNGIEIETLHGLAFGNGSIGGDVNTLYFAAGTAAEEHGLFGSLNATTASAVSTLQLSTDDISIGEGAATVDVTITRNGDASGNAAVRYATWDASAVDHASQKSDYEINAGMVSFRAGETSKTFTIHVVNDRFDENDEVVDISLSNPAGAALGSPNHAQLTIQDNDTGAPTTNPIDDTAFFVRQHYVDFHGREPASLSLAYWSKIINACGTNTTCRRQKRASVSSQVLLSQESVDTFGLPFRMYRAAFKRDALYGEVMVTSTIADALGIGVATNTIVTSPAFVAKYAALSNTSYVNALAANSGFGFSAAKKTAWVSKLNAHTLTRGGVLLQLSNDPGYVSFVRRRWIVLTTFWAYDRRDADVVTFNNRLAQLNAGAGDPLASGLVNTMLTSPEYRQRFSLN